MRVIQVQLSTLTGGSRFFIPVSLIRERSHLPGAFQRMPNLCVLIVGGEEMGTEPDLMLLWDQATFVKPLRAIRKASAPTSTQ